MNTESSAWFERKTKRWLDGLAPFRRGDTRAADAVRNAVGPAVGWYDDPQGHGVVVFGLDGIAVVRPDGTADAIRYAEMQLGEGPAKEAFDGKLDLRCDDGRRFEVHVTGTSGDGGRFKDLYAVKSFLVGMRSSIERRFSTRAETSGAQGHSRGSP